MIISDLDYLESVTETSAMDLHGGNYTAISEFSALATGNSNRIKTSVINRVINAPKSSISISSVSLNLAASSSGREAFVSASATSTSSAS